MLKKSVYRIYFQDMNKREAKKLMANFNLIDKKGILKKNFILFHFIFFSLYKEWIIQLIIKETEKKHEIKQRIIIKITMKD